MPVSEEGVKKEERIKWTDMLREGIRVKIARDFEKGSFITSQTTI